jgi:hypothetical protein
MVSPSGVDWTPRVPGRSEALNSSAALSIFGLRRCDRLWVDFSADADVDESAG